MNEKELDKLQQDLLKNIDNEVETDNMIHALTDEITGILYTNGSVSGYEIQNKPYSFRLAPGRTKDEVVVVAVNNTRFKITDGKGGLFTARANVEEGYDAKECLRCIVEAFVRQETGNFKPDMLEDNN